MANLPPSVQAQLVSAANAADRANKPARLIVFALLLLVLGVSYAFLSYNQLAEAKRDVENARARAGQIRQLVQRIRMIESGGVDYASVYPRDAYVETKIVSAAEMENVNFDRDPTVGDRTTTSVAPNSPVERADILCRATGADLDDVLQWIENAVNEPTLKGRLFLSSISMSPLANGWQVQFTLSMYQVK